MKKGFETIGDLLAHDDVNKVIESFIEKIKPTAKEVIIIYVDNEEDTTFTCSGMTNEHMLWLLEVIKTRLLLDSDEDEDEDEDES